MVLLETGRWVWCWKWILNSKREAARTERHRSTDSEATPTQVLTILLSWHLWCNFNNRSTCSSHSYTRPISNGRTSTFNVSGLFLSSCILRLFSPALFDSSSASLPLSRHTNAPSSLWVKTRNLCRLWRNYVSTHITTSYVFVRGGETVSSLDSS